MNCLAIGDMFIPAKYFDSALKTSHHFGISHFVQWSPVRMLSEMRSVIRKIETEGSLSFPVPEAALPFLNEVEVLFVHLCPICRRTIESAPNLKYILTARGGFENLDMTAIKEKKITVFNCPAHNSVAVAEYTIGLIIAEMRNIGRSFIGLRQGKWIERYSNSDAIPELRTSIAGIIGFGTIGRLVAARLMGFGTKVIVFDPYVGLEQITSAGLEAVTLEELLRVSDIVSLHARTVPEAPPIIGPRELSLMKPTAYLINTARAALVDFGALYETLRYKRIRGAALDVFPEEPVPMNNPMLSLDNVTLTNHRAGDTLNSYMLAPYLLVRQFEDFLLTHV